MRLFKSKAFLGGICLLVAAGIAFFVIPRFYAGQKATASVIRPAQEIAAAKALLADGDAWMTGSVWQGRRVLRIAVSNWATTTNDVRRSLAALGRAVGASG